MASVVETCRISITEEEMVGFPATEWPTFEGE
jgi:hypothetical protein